jgi:hypothetical protein
MTNRSFADLTIQQWRERIAAVLACPGGSMTEWLQADGPPSFSFLCARPAAGLKEKRGVLATFL